ncbi:hypothetical protein [Acutalibacter caecimuris]|uniref:hypothetical protein n=1 Tax=Acutalibacter caecimuris TaxID=3093657 RepID=UPI002AC9E9B0|nr:hypothetical protein [Acutalibacter sp. M00118]
MEVRIYGTPKELAALVQGLRPRIVTLAEWAEETAQKIPDLFNQVDAGEQDSNAPSSE